MVVCFRSMLDSVVVSLPNSVGMVPTNEFCPSETVFSELIMPNSVGMRPTSDAPSTCSVASEPRFPSSDGSSPPSDVLTMDRLVSPSTRAIEVGNGPSVCGAISLSSIDIETTRPLLLQPRKELVPQRV